MTLRAPSAPKHPGSPGCTSRRFFSLLGWRRPNKTLLRIQNDIFFPQDFTFLILRRKKRGWGVLTPLPVAVFSLYFALWVRAGGESWKAARSSDPFPHSLVGIGGHRGHRAFREEMSPPPSPCWCSLVERPMVGKRTTIQYTPGHESEY